MTFASRWKSWTRKLPQRKGAGGGRWEHARVASQPSLESPLAAIEHGQACTMPTAHGSPQSEQDQTSDWPPCVHILGVPVHVVQTSEVVHLMERWIQQRNGRRWIAVTSSHGVVEGYKYPEFKAILKSAALSVPDGKWTARVAARQAGCATRQVCGTDLLCAFCQLASQKGYRNFFYGDTEEVLSFLVRRLQRGYPALPIVGSYSPPFRDLTPAEDTKITSLINLARPDVLWVGLGLPKQERWIFEHRDKLNVPVMVAVGAAFKFAAGKVKRAPAWIREVGLEWLWRLMQEPGRCWQRVVIYGPQFVARSLLELGGLRKYE